MEIGTRCLSSHELFAFSTSKVDRNFHADSAHIQWHGTKALAPPTFNIVQLPDQHTFHQSHGVMLLESSNRLRFSLPDPLILVTKLRITISLPPIRIRWQSRIQPAAGAQGPINQRISHPYLRHPVTHAQLMRWLEAELTHEKADYHMEVLKGLPFKKLQLLELEFCGHAFGHRNPDRNAAVARWIARYFHFMSVDRKAKAVKIVAEDKTWASIVEEGMVNGLAPWIGNL